MVPILFCYSFLLISLEKKLPFLDMLIKDLGKDHFSDSDIKDEVNAFLGAV
jgi:hypothetical protein